MTTLKAGGRGFKSYLAASFSLRIEKSAFSLKVPIFSRIAEYAILCRVCFKFVYFPYAVATSNPFLFHFHFPYRHAISLQCVDSGIDMRSLTAQHLNSTLLVITRAAKRHVAVQ